MRLSQGSQANIKPEQILEAFYLNEGKEYPVYDLQVERVEIYADEGDGTEHRFRALEDYGTEF